jgi:Fe-S-cluster containining protein
MLRILQPFEHVHCRCSACSTPCTSGKPGVLAPSEAATIGEYFGIDIDGDDYVQKQTEFVRKNFVAANDGPTAPNSEFPSGQTPAIRPAVREDGRCIFLRDNGDCACYPVAPFECRMTRQCAPQENAAALRALGIAISQSPEYVLVWMSLREQAALREQGLSVPEPDPITTHPMDLQCHSCQKRFTFELDLWDVDDQTVICPHCGTVSSTSDFPEFDFPESRE